MTQSIFRLLSCVVIVSLATTAQADIALYLDFDNNINDQSGNGLTTGQMSDLPTATSAVGYSGDVAGAIGSGTSGSFDGSAAVDVAPNAVLDSGAFTLMFFIKPQDQGGPDFNRLTARSDFRFDTAIGSPSGGVGNELSYFNYQGVNGWFTQTTVPVGSWTHVAYQNRAGGLDLYINGVLVATGLEVSAANFGGNRMRVGGTIGLNPAAQAFEGYAGLMDDLLLWNDSSNALDSGDIAFIAANGVDAFLNPSVIPAPAALPAGLALIGFIAARRRR